MSTEFIPLGVSSSLAEKKTISPTKRKEPNSSHGTSPVKDAYKGFLQNHFFHNNSTPTSSTKLASSPTKLPNLSNSGVAHSLSNGLVTPEKRPKRFTFSQTGSQQSIADSNSSIKHRAIQATNFKTVRGYLQEAKTLPLVLDFEPKSKKKTGLETKSTLNIYEERVLKQISLPKSPAQASSNDKRHLNNILKDVVSGDVLESPLRKKDIHEFLADDWSSPYSPDDLNSNPSPLKLELKSSESRPIHSPPRKIMTSYGSRVLSEQSFQLHPATHSDDKDSKNSKVSLKFHLAVNQTKIPTLTLSKSVHSPGRHFNFKFSKQELEAALKNSHEKKTENKADHHFNRTATAGGSRTKNNLIEKYKKRINQEFQYRFPQKTNPEIKEESLQSNRYYVPTFVSEDLSKHHQASNSFKISERNSFNEVVFAKVFGSKASHHKTPAHEQQVVDDNLVLGEEEEENEDSEQATNSFTESSYSDDDDNTGSEVSDKMKHVGKRFSGFKIIRRVSQYHKTIKRESFLKKLERVDQAIRSRGQMPAPRITNDDDKFFVTLEKKRKLNNIRKKILSALTRMRALGLTVEDVRINEFFFFKVLTNENLDWIEEDIQHAAIRERAL